jgi:uncharacterized phage-associated protein
MANAVDVARYLIDLAKEDNNKTLTNMQLQKLVYIAHGLHLARNAGKPLLDKEINAWKHGPVIPSVYHAFKEYGDNAVDSTEGARNDDLTVGNTKAIEESYKIFGGLSGWTLRDVTHKKGSPWYEIWYNEGKTTYNAVIPNEVIERHYDKIVTEGKATVL